MVIGKRLEAHDFRAELPQRPLKGFRIADAAEAEDPLTGNLGQRLRLSGTVDELARPKRNFDHHANLIVPHQLRADRSQLFRRDLIRACDNHQVRAFDIRDRLAEQATRQAMSETPRIRGINQHDVEVPMHSAMLESVVEDQQIAAIHNRSFRRQDAIRVEPLRHSRTKLIEHELLIVDLRVERLVAATQ